MTGQVRIRSHRAGEDHSQAGSPCKTRGFRDGFTLDMGLPCLVGRRAASGLYRSAPRAENFEWNAEQDRCQ